MSGRKIHRRWRDSDRRFKYHEYFYSTKGATARYMKAQRAAFENNWCYVVSAVLPYDVSISHGIVSWNYDIIQRHIKEDLNSTWHTYWSINPDNKVTFWFEDASDAVQFTLFISRLS